MGGPGGGGGERRGASFGASSPNGASNGLRPKKGEEVSAAAGGPMGLPGMAGLLLWRSSWSWGRGGEGGVQTWLVGSCKGSAAGTAAYAHMRG